MELSEFGNRLSKETGIGQLMDDLGKAMSSSSADTCMLGGGNPGHIPEVEAILREKMKDILNTPGLFEHVLGDYVTPRGDDLFIDALVDLLNSQFNWNVKPENVVLTNGSQTGFFMLFNMLAGPYADGTKKKILFPLCPEYIGYADLGLSDDFLVANKPEITPLDAHTFKYHINFDTLEVGPDIAAICVSRPTNPTGNVVTDEEVNTLRSIAKEKNIPLIIDNAYGVPFPGVIFTETTPVWDEGMVMCMTLSKLGLPGARTGIIIASEEITTAIANMNAVLSLAPNSLGSALTYDLVKTGEITRIGRDIIKPFYEEKSQKAYRQFVSGLDGLDVSLHKPEGSMFLWLWLRDCPVRDQELYNRLKERGVLIVPGNYFFHGLREEWHHQRECIRVTFTQNESMVEKGIDLICDEIRKTYSKPCKGRA